MLQKTDSNIENKLEDAPTTRKKGIISRLKKPIYSFLAGIVLLGSVLYAPNCVAESKGKGIENWKRGYREIDYENMNLLYSDRVKGMPDFYRGKVVFAADIEVIN